MSSFREEVRKSLSPPVASPSPSTDEELINALASSGKMNSPHYWLGCLKGANVVTTGNLRYLLNAYLKA
jgi:hypothetical protein